MSQILFHKVLEDIQSQLNLDVQTLAQEEDTSTLIKNSIEKFISEEKFSLISLMKFPTPFHTKKSNKIPENPTSMNMKKSTKPQMNMKKNTQRLTKSCENPCKALFKAPCKTPQLSRSGRESGFTMN